jgi:fibronectin-binding autotransporter adhesin
MQVGSLARKKMNTGNGRSRRRILLAVSSGILGISGSSALHAAVNYNWDPTMTATTSGGGAGTWDKTTADWYTTSDVVWADGNTAIFGGSLGGGTVNLAVPISANAINFNSGGYTIAANGTNTLTLTNNGGGGITAAIYSNTGGGTNTISGPLIIGAAGASIVQYWDVVTGDTLNLTGAVSNGGNGILIATGGGNYNFSGTAFTPYKFSISGGSTFSSSGTVSLSAAGTYTGVGDGGTGTLNVTNGSFTTAATMFLGTGSTSGNINTGTVNLTNGTITTGNTVNIGDGYSNNSSDVGVINISGGTFSTGATAGSIRLGNLGSGSGTINLNGGTLSTDSAIAPGSYATSIAGETKASIFNFNGGTLLATGTGLSMPNTVTANVRDGGANFNTGSFAVTIAANLVKSTLTGDLGTGGLTKLGSGTLTLSGTNTFAGNINVSAGALVVTPGSGATTNSSIPAGDTLSMATGTTFGITFQGADGATKALVLSNFNLNLSGGTVTFGGPNLDVVTVPGTVNLTGTDTFSTSNIREEMILAGPVTGTGNLTFTSSGAQSSSFLVFSGTSTYSGSTLVTNNNTAGASIQLAGGANRLPTTTTLTLNGGASFQSQFDLAGQNQTLAGLLATGTTANADVVNSNASTTSILTINNASNETFSGLIGTAAQTLNNATVAGTNLALAKSGAGVLTLTTANGFTGGTTVNAGELYADSTLLLPLSTGAISVAAGGNVTFGDHAGGVPAIPNNITLNGSGIAGSTITTNGILGYGALGFYNSANFNMSGSITLASNSVIRSDAVNQTAAITFAGLISGPGSLTLEGGESATSGGYPHFVLTQANTYGTTTPATLLTSDGVNPTATPMLVELSTVNNALPASTVLTFGGAPAEATNPNVYNKNITLALDGVNQTVAGLTNGSSGAYSIVGNSATQSTFTIANTVPYSFSGSFGGGNANANNIALVVAGSSTFTLRGSSTYFGATTVSSGTLLAGAANALSPNSAVNVSGGTLDVSGYNNSIASLTVGSAGTLNLGIGNLLTTTGAASFAGTLNLSGTAGMLPENLVLYNSATGTFTTVTGVPSGDQLLYTATALELATTVAAGPATLTWDNLGGTGNGMTWDTVQQNFNNGTGVVAYKDTSNPGIGGDNVIFNDTNNGNYNVSIPSVVHPTSTTVNATGNYLFNGSGGIGGVGGLTKLGTGILTLNTSNSYTGATNVSGGRIVLGVAGALPSGTNLTIASGASVFASNLGSTTALTVGSLTVAGKLDLNNNALIVHNGSIGAVSALVATGFNGGVWNNSTGITSYAAANDSTHLTALGVIQNSADGTTTGTVLHSTFEGQTSTSTDVLVKYTYYGDANLDGKVDGSDYSRIDGSYLAESTEPMPFSVGISGWYNGDFNYDGVVDGSDYTLIDNAFNSQGAQLSALVASPDAVATAQIAGGAASSVPEPATLGLLGIGALGLLGRRRRGNH